MKPFIGMGYGLNKLIFGITVTEEPYLLGVLNSPVTQYLVSQSAATRQGGFLEYKPMYISPLSIPKPTDTQDACVTRIVDKILEIKRQNPKADTRELERKIDEIVYKLYGLTEEEIQIIEESGKR